MVPQSVLQKFTVVRILVQKFKFEIIFSYNFSLEENSTFRICNVNYNLTCVILIKVLFFSLMVLVFDLADDTQNLRI